MTVSLAEEPRTVLREYARIPIVFTVDRIFDVTSPVPACRFYERQGCQLRAVNRAVYPELPEEIQLLWYKDLPA